MPLVWRVGVRPAHPCGRKANGVGTKGRETGLATSDIRLGLTHSHLAGFDLPLDIAISRHPNGAAAGSNDATNLPSRSLRTSPALPPVIPACLSPLPRGATSLYISTVYAFSGVYASIRQLDGPTVTISHRSSKFIRMAFWIFSTISSGSSRTTSRVRPYLPLEWT